MGTTSITITDEAYNYLKSIKGKRSFSETILSMSRSGEDVIRFAGIFHDTDFKEVEDARKKINRDWDRRR